MVASRFNFFISGEIALGGFQHRLECVPPAFVERWALEATGGGKKLLLMVFMPYDSLRFVALLPLGCLDELGMEPIGRHVRILFRSFYFSHTHVGRAGIVPPLIVEVKTNKGLKAYASVVDFVPNNWIVLPYWVTPIISLSCVFLLILSIYR